jgi:uncharacterized protein (DUF2225 family)
MLSGSGRLNAGALTDELHRLYEPSARYGEVYPLVYQATVCPECWYASMEKDFTLLDKDGQDKAFYDREQRMADAELVFPSVDFKENRCLLSGIVSQYLVLRCYDYFSPSFSPTIKQGLASLRAGWLLDEMNNKYPGQHYDWLAILFKKKSMFCYNEAIRLEQAGEEKLSALSNFGPDTDKNYSYEGCLYLSALLRFKYGYLDDPAQRSSMLDEAKRTIAKIYSAGKSSKAKPGPLLGHAKELYNQITKELNESDI